MNRLGRSGTPFFFAIDFEMRFPVIVPLSRMHGGFLLFNIQGRSNDYSRHHTVSANMSDNISLNPRFISRADYSRAFHLVQSEMKAGNSFLCNLTFPTLLEPDPTIRLRELYYRVHAPYRVYMNAERLPREFLQDPSAAAEEMPREFLLFSPETFVQTHHGRIYTYPMKGTSLVPEGESLDRAEKTLLEDEKERAEHITVVDLLRNDLGRVGRDIQVERFRYADAIPVNGGRLIQISSRISALLPGDWKRRLGDMTARLLPAGSVSGAPKRETCRIIAQAEGAPRGFYTGVCGIFDGYNLNSGVMIRYLERPGEKQPWGSSWNGDPGEPSAPLLFRSGGGITIYSNEADEYSELQAKVKLPLEKR
ncbi:Para-aminobenzoate synthase, aminase component [Salinispira pacifica]|uniref:Para-aminobenzoate synthase, aminase component n=2 Tax=Salinispira pacifica TaxID=1307761 RepID=V5WFA8_9SPIO|nr:Para-aminobenzoate synthase, aminase component [Salinispira pacifica]